MNNFYLNWVFDGFFTLENEENKTLTQKMTAFVVNDKL